MPRSLIGVPAWLIALAAEFGLTTWLVGDFGYGFSVWIWLLAHALACVLATISISGMLTKLIPGKRPPFMLFIFCVCFLIPLIGAAGVGLALMLGAIAAQGRHKSYEFWQFTSNAELPFAAPIGRDLGSLDSRGYIEQLKFDEEVDGMYKKVLAAKNIRDSQSAPVLKTAVQHANERIRLVAYQMLDKKATRLNREIQKLESEAHHYQGAARANVHLQIAQNYRELLTLEEDEPVAREQLLNSAADHCLTAIENHKLNVNAHFLLGQLSLQQQHFSRASTAFAKALELGMPTEKVLPYVAESAFARRDFATVKQALNQISPAFRAYPPLAGVTRYWA